MFTAERLMLILIFLLQAVMALQVNQLVSQVSCAPLSRWITVIKIIGPQVSCLAIIHKHHQRGDVLLGL